MSAPQAGAASGNDPASQRSAAGVRARVLMGVPASGAHCGGPALHLPMLVEDLRDTGRFDVRTFAYGRWREDEGLLSKMAHQFADLVRYPFLLARTRPDLVHLNTAFDRKAIVRDVFFALLTRVMRRRVLLKWHGSETELLRGPALWRVLSRILLACTDAVCVLSTEEQRALLKAGYSKLIAVVKNGLDLGRYATRCDIRSRLGLEDNSVVILFIARLIPAKGLDDVVQAMSRVDAEHAHLIVVGEGPSRAAAEARVEALGLRARVHFVGAIPEQQATEYYCGSDILVLPTYHAEGFPMSIFQAVASGMAIVTTPIRAAADHLADPANCLFVPPRDPGALATAIVRLVCAPELRDEMRRCNRELAENFDRRLVAREFAEIYANIATAHG